MIGKPLILFGGASRNRTDDLYNAIVGGEPDNRRTPPDLAVFQGQIRDSYRVTSKRVLPVSPGSPA